MSIQPEAGLVMRKSNNMFNLFAYIMYLISNSDWVRYISTSHVMLHMSELQMLHVCMFTIKLYDVKANTDKL